MFSVLHSWAALSANLRVCLPLQTPEHLKTETGEEAFNPDGLAQRSISLLKDTFPDIEVSPLQQVTAPVEDFPSPGACS